MIRFKLKIEFTDYWVWVMIHETAAELHAAIMEFDQEHHDGFQLADYARVRAVTHRRISQSGIGVLRLSREDMPVEIVAHELIHVVMWAFRLKYNATNLSGNLGRGPGNSWREERVAYMYGETLQHLVDLIYKKGLWD